MTATDELRRLLDERGVEHWDTEGITEYRGEYGRIVRCYSRLEPITLDVAIIAAPPEQAIEATLGSDLKAENEKLREQIETLVMYVEADGTRYWVDDDENQHFDHSAVKDDADELRELVRDYEELAAALCDARECDGCPFDSERTICEHMRLIARVGELGVDA